MDGSEVEAYKESYPEVEVVRCPDGVQGNYCRVRNYILDSEQERGMEVVALLDDDIKCLAYYERRRRYKVGRERFMEFLEKYSRMAKELGTKLWGVNVNLDPQCYREFAPFKMVAYIGGPFSVHVGSPIRYDEDLVLKEDYDLTLQHLNRFRRVLRLQKFHYVARQGLSGGGQVGGAAVMRNMEFEKEQFEKLQRKWGSKIVRMDTGVQAHRRKKQKSIGDWNPRLNIPIRGV